MHWIAPTEKDALTETLEEHLWGTADQCCANSGLIYHGGQVNSYYGDPHDATGHFDFVLANPPFDVNVVSVQNLTMETNNSAHASRDYD